MTLAPSPKGSGSSRPLARTDSPPSGRKESQRRSGSGARAGADWPSAEKAHPKATAKPAQARKARDAWIERSFLFRLDGRYLILFSVFAGFAGRRACRRGLLAALRKTRQAGGLFWKIGGRYPTGIPRRVRRIDRATVQERASRSLGVALQDACQTAIGRQIPLPPADASDLQCCRRRASAPCFAHPCQVRRWKQQNGCPHPRIRLRMP